MIAKSLEQKRAEWQRWYAAVRHDPVWSAKRKDDKRRSYQRHREKRLAKSKEWAKNNRVLVRKNWHRFYLANIEAERQRSKNKNPEARKESQRKYAETHRSTLNAKENKRRAVKRGVDIGMVDYEAIVREANGLCALCEKPIGESAIHIDHIVPLSRGGAHAQWNLQLTHARCNLMKGAKLLKRVG